MICECEYCAHEGEADCPLSDAQKKIAELENRIEQILEFVSRPWELNTYPSSVKISNWFESREFKAKIFEWKKEQGK